MKYCPYCGAGFSDGTVSFCSECGKKIPETTEAAPAGKESPKKATKKKSKPKKEKKEKRKKESKKKKDIPEIMGEAVCQWY